MRLSRLGRFGAIMAAGVLLVGCGTRAVDPVAIRLVDQFESAVVIGSAPAPEAPAPSTEWRFDGAGTIPAPDGAGDTWGWEALDGIEGLRVRGGRLVGTSATDLPLLHVLAPDSLDQNDQLHAIEIRMRVSDGANLGLMFRAEEEMDHDSVVEYFESALAPIPGGRRTDLLTNRGRLHLRAVVPVLRHPARAHPTDRRRGRRVRARVGEVRVATGAHGVGGLRHRLAGSG